MTDQEAMEMMRRCKDEILTLRGEVSRLRPRAEAYDNIGRILDLLPQRSVVMGEDLVWRLDKRLRELEAAATVEEPKT